MVGVISGGELWTEGKVCGPWKAAQSASSQGQLCAKPLIASLAGPLPKANRVIGDKSLSFLDRIAYVERMLTCTVHFAPCHVIEA